MKKKSGFFSLNLPDKIFGMDKALITLFLPLVGLFLLFLIVFNLVLRPKMTEIGDVNKKIGEVKANTDKIKEQNNYLASIDQEGLKRDAEYLDNAVLRDKKSYLLVEIIRELAARFDYQLESFSLTPGELKEDSESIKISSEKDTTVKMPVSLLMIGPKEKSLDLIIALEKTLPILFIDKFETKITEGLSELSLIVSSYYISSKAEVETDNVTLSDLILSKEETDLIKRISSFSKIENSQFGAGASKFQQYQRENPFSL
jgi:hypothetical protein